MQNLYHNTKYQDIHFQLDDGKIYGAHRVVLDSSNVEWFKTILNSQFGDSVSKTVTIKGIESKVFKIALKYAYTFQPLVSEFTFEVLYPIFKAATYFLCPELVRLIVDRTYLTEQYILILLDCIIQSGFTEITPKFTVKIYSIIKYFSGRYLNDDLTLYKEMIKEAWKICSIDQDDILSYLSASGVTDDEKSLILLKKITYNSHQRNKIISILNDLAARKLIPYSENIHLPLYPKGYIIIKNKISYLVSSINFDETHQMDMFLCGWNSASRSMIHDIKPGSLPENEDHWYIYYAKPENDENNSEGNMLKKSKQCSYIFTRGVRVSERCPYLTKPDSDYCRACLKKTAVQKLLANK